MSQTVPTFAAKMPGMTTHVHGGARAATTVASVVVGVDGLRVERC